MATQKPTPLRNNLPPLLHGFNAREVYLFTQIPLFICELIISGLVKPNANDRKKLTDLSNYFYRSTESEIRKYVDDKKLKAVKPFLSQTEMEALYSDLVNFSQNLDQLLVRHWDEVIVSEGLK